MGEQRSTIILTNAKRRTLYNEHGYKIDIDTVNASFPLTLS